MAPRVFTLVKIGLNVVSAMVIVCMFVYQWNKSSAGTRYIRGSSAYYPEESEYYQSMDIRNLTRNATDSPQQRSPGNDHIEYYDEEWLWMDKMEQIRLRRIEHKESLCKELRPRHIRTVLPSKSQFDLTYSNDDHHFLVTTVWKIGASHWKNVFRVLRDNGSVEFQKRQPDPHYPMSKMQDFSAKFENYYKVIFVRHPFARLVSAYRDKVGGTKIPFYLTKNRAMLRKVRPGATEDEIQAANVTFLDFITWVTTGGQNSDLHWKPINTKYSICQIPYDFIGKVESISDDTTYLFKLLGVDGLVTYRDAYNHTGSGDESLLREYYSTIPDEMISKLTEVYRLDFNMFGYRKPKSNSDFIDANDLKGL